MTTAIKYLDRLPPGWFTLEVMREEPRKQDWVALMVDVHPDEYRLGRKARAAWVRVPGKHRNRDTAWDALQDMMETRH
jgi:hypothetical protein